MCSDKFKALHLIEEMQCQNKVDEKQFILSDVLLIDAMAVLNQIKKIINYGNLQSKHMLKCFLLSTWCIQDFFFSNSRTMQDNEGHFGVFCWTILTLYEGQCMTISKINP